MEVRTRMIMRCSAACHSTCKDCLSVTSYCFPVVELFARSATDWRRRLRFTGTVCQLRKCFPVVELFPRSATDLRRRLRFTGTACQLRNCFPVADLSPRSATSFVGGCASPGLFASSGTVSPWLICLTAPPPPSSEATLQRNCSIFSR